MFLLIWLTITLLVYFVVAIIFPSWNYDFYLTLELHSFDWNIFAASVVFGFIVAAYYIAKRRDDNKG